MNCALYDINGLRPCLYPWCSDYALGAVTMNEMYVLRIEKACAAAIEELPAEIWGKRCVFVMQDGMDAAAYTWVVRLPSMT